MTQPDLLAQLADFLVLREAELIDFRRDLHAHPELGYREHRTTSRVMQRLAAAGLRPVTLPKGTGWSAGPALTATGLGTMTWARNPR